MHIKFDSKANASYIKLAEGKFASNKKISEDIIIDFDNKGKLLGVEILNASKVMEKKVLIEAQHN